MRTISDTIERLSKYRGIPLGKPVGSSTLRRLARVEPNPGQLDAFFQIPETTDEAPALVVVLHGCTQTAAGYDYGSGWSKLASDYGFAVLFPEQSRQNNANLCFNWFQSEDTTRDRGEVMSIRAMVSQMISEHGIDPKRVFVTGLSAGGAMANALLATYPEVFAGGAIIAGLPYGAASTVPEAFDRMRGHGMPSSPALEAKLRGASGHRGPWPTVSVWHGSADNTVVEVNASAIIDQWRGIHTVGSKPAEVTEVNGQIREAWEDASGREVLEFYHINGMAHGTPLETTSGYGQTAPYMLEVGISSTVHIARNWGLTPSFSRREIATDKESRPLSSGQARVGGIQDIIEGALRSAGLMK